MKTQVSNATAWTAYFDISAAIAPHCTLITSAGSLRRCRIVVGDIEIVCVPRSASADLFGGPIGRDPKFAPALIGLDATITKGDPHTGRYVQLIYKGIQVDIFMPRPEDYGRILAIRTGPSEYSKKIALAWAKMGWCGTPQGLRLRSQCRHNSGKWECTESNPILPPPFYTESEFFTFLGWEYLAPQNR